MVDKPTNVEESKVLEAKYFGSSFLLLLDFEVLAQTHGKEKGKNGELQYSTLQPCKILLCNFGNNLGGDGFFDAFLWGWHF